MKRPFEPPVGLRDAEYQFRVAFAVNIKALAIILIVRVVRLITPPVTEWNTGLDNVVESLH